MYTCQIHVLNEVKPKKEKNLSYCEKAQKHLRKSSKKFVTLLDLCVSSLRRGHANLLCIVPILSDDPRRESDLNTYVCIHFTNSCIHTHACMHAYIHTYIHTYIHAASDIEWEVHFTGSPHWWLDPVCLLVYMRYAITGLVCVPGMQQFHAACN